MPSFALLGIGARGAGFRDRQWPLPNAGHISWTRWRDRDWGPDGTRPMLNPRIDCMDDAESLPDEFTEEWLDESAEAGRFVFNILDPSPFEDEHDAASAYGDAFAGLLSVPAPLGYEPEVVELAPEWIASGEVTIQDVDAADRRATFARTVTTRDSWVFDDELVAHLMSLICPTVEDGDTVNWGALPAVLEYRLSVSEFAFALDERELLCGVDMDVEPQTPFERRRLERVSTTGSRASKHCSTASLRSGWSHWPSD